MYKYSVIIPTLNEEARIAGLIKDFKNQTIPPFEIIIADKSTDKTAEIAKALGAKVVEGVNDYHIGKARNNGARTATTNILAFFDADNTLSSPNYMENIITEMSSRKLDVIHGTLIPEKKSLSSMIGYFLYNFFRKLGPILHTIISDVGSGIIAQRNVFIEIGGFREDIKNSEDILFLRKVLKNGFRYSISNERLMASERRFKFANAKQLFKRLTSSILLTILFSIGFNSKGKIIKYLERQYWNERDYTK